ncbi:hypothetical protein WRSd3_00948 [Shigella dysenteriae WRSd3]|uniref:Uncharacterized protein n=1 Tax=Shigella dysenteriae WRSd3 TaxID=1401327 RepID=A0A090NLE1_SHIDY|nr:hypothetical protein WRSd3_00948 [Shigella dysenteriae WRSd3]
MEKKGAMFSYCIHRTWTLAYASGVSINKKSF